MIVGGRTPCLCDRVSGGNPMGGDPTFALACVGDADIAQRLFDVFWA